MNRTTRLQVWLTKAFLGATALVCAASIGWGLRSEPYTVPDVHPRGHASACPGSETNAGTRSPDTSARSS